MDKRDETMGQWDTIRDDEGASWQAAPDATFGNLPTLQGEGVVLAGRYKVVKRLGEGGMGSVWLAEDAKLNNRKVAVKMLPAILAGKKGAYRQVKAEAMMAMKLSHPNIATVRSFEEDEGGNPFLVMDYVEGEPLDDILAERGPLGEEETVKLLGPAAAALDYAHSQGVVHRDVKPGNVMVRKDGVPFVLDFGIAREIQETMTMVTGKMSSGTLLYMSPEQLKGRAPKAAQDVYSFAAMVYECLAGRPPFSRGQIEWQIVNEVPEELPGSVGEGLRKGVMAGLAKEAGERPETCAGVLGGGGAICSGEPGKGTMAGTVARPEGSRHQRFAMEGSPFPQGDGLVQQRETELEPESQEREAGQGAEARSETEKKGEGSGAGWVFALLGVLVLAWGGHAMWEQGRKSVVEESTRLWDGTQESEAREVGLPNGETMRLRWCPEGRFTMGSPRSEEGRDPNETRHEVTLTRGFWMAETEVTQGQWKSLMGTTVADLAKKGLQDDTGYDSNDGKGAITMREQWGMQRDGDPMDRCGNLDDDVPVYNVSWSEAREFCQRLTERERNAGRLPLGYSYRLPTEAEWEYACRAGTKTALPNGKDLQILGQHNAPALDDIAWYGGNSSVGFEGGGWDTESWPEKQYPGGLACVRKVGLKEANGWGLKDMIGNVWEWCLDEFGGYPMEPVTDYARKNDTTASGVRRVARGGSWNNGARYCRSAFRGWSPAGVRHFDIGFRPVCSAGRAE